MLQNARGYLFRIESFLFSILLENNHRHIITIIHNREFN